MDVLVVVEVANIAAMVAIAATLSFVGASTVVLAFAAAPVLVVAALASPAFVSVLLGFVSSAPVGPVAGAVLIVLVDAALFYAAPFSSPAASL